MSDNADTGVIGLDALLNSRQGSGPVISILEILLLIEYSRRVSDGGAFVLLCTTYALGDVICRSSRARNIRRVERARTAMST